MSVRNPAARGRQDRNAPAINKAAEQLGVCVVRTHMIGGGKGDAIWQWLSRRYSEHHGPKTVYVEIKTDGGKQSPRQKDFQAKWEAAGGEYRIVRDLDDVQRLILGHG